MQYDIFEESTLSQLEGEKAARCAVAQAAIDLADRTVIEAQVSSRTDSLVHAHMRLQAPSWYIHVTMYHRSEDAKTHELYRVWPAEGAWKAAYVGQILPKRERGL
jgi:hypothetical protein